jgi:predicted dienelactone hydrolase/CubicO group peptidase (beta-lactamase class C family)
MERNEAAVVEDAVTSTAIRAALAALLILASVASGLDRGAPGPHEVRTVERIDLRDEGRGKDLRVRVTHPTGDGPFPVVVWSHGATATKDDYEPLARHWASHGFVVIRPSHADARSLTGRSGPGAGVFLGWRDRPRDVAFVLDSLAAIERRVPALAGKLDRTRVGAGGHSYGAHTAQLLAGATTRDAGGRRESHADARPRAFLLLSPQGVGEHAAGLDESSWKDVTRPLLLVTGTKDYGRKGDDWRWRLDPYRYAPPPDKFLLVIEDAWHGFGGIVGDAGFRGRGPDDPDQRRCVQRVSTAFWDAYLRGDAKAAAFLRSEASLCDGKARLAAKDAVEPAATSVEDATWRDKTRDRDVPVRIHAPAKATGLHPAVVFSHGGGESREAYGYLGEHLARHGYAVVFLTHVGSDRAAVDARGLRGLGGLDDRRPRDVLFVLDRLLSADPGSALLRDRVDRDRVAVAGQCAGTTTVIPIVGGKLDLPGRPGVSFPDERVRACVLLGPQPGPDGRGPLRDDSWSGVRVPTLVVTGTRDFGWIRAVREDPKLLRRPYDGLPPGRRHLVEIRGASHAAFTDSVPYYPSGERDPRHHGWIAEAVTTFLDAWLRGDEDARRRLATEALERATDGECREEHDGEGAGADAGRSVTSDVSFADPVTLRDDGRGKDLRLRVTWPEADGPHPVILLSHAVGGARHDYGPLVAHWARHGHVVIQPEHADSRDLETRGPRLDWANRARDLSFVLDSLAEIERQIPALVGRLDRGRIGAAGHLIGAYAACVLAGQRSFAPRAPTDLADERVGAALLLSPQGRGQGLTEPSWKEIQVPLMVLTGSEIPSRRTGNPATWRKEPFTFGPTGETYLVWIEGLDGRYAGLVRPGVGEDRARAGWILDATLAFWKGCLGEGDEAARRLLDGEALRRASGGRATIVRKDGGEPAEAVRVPPWQRCVAASDYSARSGGRAVLVWADGQTVFERYDHGAGRETATHLHSATKAFWGPVVAAMITDGLVSSFDELACETLPEWKEDPRKRTITLRHLLTLSAGLAQDVPMLQGFRGRAEDKYAHAVGLAVDQPVGSSFRYGPSCCYALGEILERKLRKRGQSPLEYLRERILDPIGCEVADWKHDPSGNPHLPNGASLTARNWLRYGVFLQQRGTWEGKPILPEALFAELVRPSEANPGHGLTLWLNTPRGFGVSPLMKAPPESAAGFLHPAGEPDLYAALGAGKCRLYVVPSRRLVVLRQCDEPRDTFRDDVFLGLLLEGRAPRRPAAGGNGEDASWRRFAMRARVLAREMQHEGRSREEIRRAVVELAREMGLDPAEIRERLRR